MTRPDQDLNFRCATCGASMGLAPNPRHNCELVDLENKIKFAEIHLETMKAYATGLREKIEADYKRGA